MSKGLYSMLLLMAAGLFLGALFQPATAQLRGSNDKVTVSSYLSVDQVPVGSSFYIAIVLDIEDSWHINAHRPTLDYLIGTEVSMDPTDGFIISNLYYPEPHYYEFAFAGGEELLVYEGRTPVFLEVRASSQLEPGTYIMEGYARVQACDDQNCLAPSNLPLSIEIRVSDAEKSARKVNEHIFSELEDIEEGASTDAEQSEIERLFQEGGFIWALIALFFIGLALNLTPCVYPMMSVTVSLFGAQNDPNMFRVFLKAVVYVLGIATMYSTLGVLASFSGELFGSWLQHPWVLAGIGLLLFALALSMFGLYEIQIPYWLSSKLGSGQSTGFIGTWLSGLVVGIFAAPCIGPPIIALLAFIGAQGDPLLGFWTFFVLSLGLGFPYLILGTFSGLMPKMPKSGVWMIWVKKVFGVVLVALALFYLAMPFIPVSQAYWVIPIALIIGGVYLGFLESSGKGTPVFSKIKMGFGILSILIGVLVYNNLQKEQMTWEMYSEERIQEAALEGQPVMLDFYADWCIPCLELERITFTHQDVIEKGDQFVRLKVDLTHFDSPESEEIRRAYNVAGVPTIVFLDENGREVTEARVVGFLGADEFLKRMALVFD
ncbi:cytochrome c biogenesis protein CcdA [Balneolaceae bacterium ANBcel3]|nr:cytochrome c biogenesis protein CcdA [Balneolaceae bacterium ANBcel3]